MIIPKLALKNVLGVGLRTWLNVVVLSLSFVLIIFSQGLLEGMNRQAEEAPPAGVNAQRNLSQAIENWFMKRL